MKVSAITEDLVKKVQSLESIVQQRTEELESVSNSSIEEFRNSVLSTLSNAQQTAEGGLMSLRQPLQDAPRRFSLGLRLFLMTLTQRPSRRKVSRMKNTRR